MKFWILTLLFLVQTVLSAQPDTNLLIRPERLLEKDINRKDIGRNTAQSVSATRTLEEIDKLPFTVWVITAEEIALYGMVTLGDVLRAAPGIRVSQPGNAIEGETFLMRGLSGNEYVKVLINDVPVKPSLAKGMPIGAQLPIRQAERIEVLYGPAGSIYGNEACAGVVNIILKETERPIFTQADLSFGKYGYNSLDLMFGGKLGKDKKILRYSLFGSSTIREVTDLFHDQNIYKAENYLPYNLDSTVYYYNPNFRQTTQGNSIPELSKVAHQSRLFGFNLAYRGMRFSYERMYRSDYSALGRNTLAMSWANPADQLNEKLETFMLGFTRQRKRWTVNTNFSAQFYQVINSTSTHVFSELSSNFYALRKDGLVNPNDQLIILDAARFIFDSDQRFSFSRSFDSRFETRFNTSLSSNLYLETALQLNVGGGTPLTTQSKDPLSADLFGFLDYEIYGTPYLPYSVATVDANAFGQIEWRGPRLTLIGGTAINYVVFSETQTRQPILIPRGALLFRIDSFWSVFANYSTGFRHANLYNIANTITFRDTFGEVSAGVLLQDNNQGWFEKTERTEAYEAGIRYKKEGFRANLSSFRQVINNYIRPNQTQKYLNEFDFVHQLTGYNNIPGRGQLIWGLQGLFTWESKGSSIDLGKKSTKIRSKTEIYTQYSRGKEWLGNGLGTTNDVFNMPRWMVQFRTTFRSGKFQMMLASNRQTSVLSKSAAYKTAFQLKNTIDYYPTFRSWDMVMRVYLDNHFVVYFQMQNMFNRHFAGLDAYGTPQDLQFNPQQGRIWRLGVNYSMN
jgi:outer membrane receptor protein involved in Fe transport